MSSIYGINLSEDEEMIAEDMGLEDYIEDDTLDIELGEDIDGSCLHNFQDGICNTCGEVEEEVEQ